MNYSLISPLGGIVIAANLSITPLYAVVTIDYALVGNARNSNDANGFGGVAYDYKISRNETTISQYAEFLNAVAKTDIHGLYNTSMTEVNINGISRSGLSGDYSYLVTSGSGNRPITYVSWFDAARFTNWLHNGQPTGGQTLSTTEDGAYTLNGAISGIITRNLAATFWIPSESEWYKAAYYDPTKDGIGGYWLHANQSNIMNTNSIGMAGAANYFDGDYVGFPGAALTDVGAYGANSESYYGTNDQAGNVHEWNDAVTGSTRGQRGGSWVNNSGLLPASASDGSVPTAENSIVGFRVASVPEPSAVLLTFLAASLSLARRRRSAL